MSSKQAKTRCGNTMTESAWLAWVRSALRSKSLKWPPRNQALQAARRAYEGDNKLQRWEYKCAMCSDHFKAKEVCVDHYPKAAGSILCVQDIGEFANNLFCELNNLRVLCIDCHALHTLCEKNGITMTEARLQKRVTEYFKQNAKEKILAMLKEKGYDNNSVSNNEKRKLLVYNIFKQEGQNG